jgi:hypothetical protein
VAQEVDVVEELLAGEVLEVRVINPALAHLPVGEGVDVLQQQQPHRNAARQPGPTFVAEQRRDLIVNPPPIDRASEPHQLVLQVDDLIEPHPQNVQLSRLALLSRPHNPADTDQTDTGSESHIIIFGNRAAHKNCKVPGFDPQNLAIQTSLKPQKTPPQRPIAFFTADHESVV